MQEKIRNMKLDEQKTKEYLESIRGKILKQDADILDP